MQTNVVEWRIVFFIAAGFYFVGNLLFVVLGKTEVQPWNSPEDALRLKHAIPDAETPALLPSSNGTAVPIIEKQQNGGQKENGATTH